MDDNGLKDEPLAWLNNGRTSGLLMGNYLSLYFAEYLLSRISNELQENIEADSLNCVFKYFSDDFYFFCNNDDIEKVLNLFDKVLAEYDFVRNEKKKIWTYETYNTYNCRKSLPQTEVPLKHTMSQRKCPEKPFQSHRCRYQVRNPLFLH